MITGIASLSSFIDGPGNWNFGVLTCFYRRGWCGFAVFVFDPNHMIAMLSSMLKPPSLGVAVLSDCGIPSCAMIGLLDLEGNEEDQATSLSSGQKGKEGGDGLRPGRRPPARGCRQRRQRVLWPHAITERVWWPRAITSCHSGCRQKVFLIACAFSSKIKGACLRLVQFQIG